MMIRLNSSQIACAVAALLLLASQLQIHGQSPTDGTKQPNIIFILADDQGWNGTSVQMHPDMPDSKSDYYHTPNLEKLASHGMRFSQAYSPGPMCSPTRASLQTGKSPAQLGMTTVGRGGRPASPAQKLIPAEYSSTLPRAEITIGETLRQAGYATAWFGKWHLGPDGPGAHGYDVSDGPTGNANGVIEDPQNPKDIFGITDRGIAFMEKNTKLGKPFYLQLWHYAVHGPVQSRPETEQAYGEKARGQHHQSASFAGMTENLDTGVGMIVDKVNALGIADNTYIVYMSDHGSSRNLSDNTPLNRGKGTLWEGGVRVPLIISGPGVKPGVFCDAATVGWDLYPTFCELAHIKRELPAGLEGVSLAPLLESGRGSLDRSSHALALHFPHYGQSGPHSTITHEGFKLIKYYDGDELRLFDLSRDIGEQNNLAEKEPEKAAMLHRRLNDYLAKVDAKMPSVNPQFDPQVAAANQGRQGGRRSRRDQIAARQKELAALEEALKANDMKKLGESLAQMRKALENAPQRPPRRPRPGGAGRPGAGGPGGGGPGAGPARGGPGAGGPRGAGGPGGRRPGGGTAARQQRQQDLDQLTQAHADADVEQLAKLISEIKERLEAQSNEAR